MTKIPVSRELRAEDWFENDWVVRVSGFELTNGPMHVGVRQSCANSLIDAYELDTPFSSNVLKCHMRKQTENHGVGGSIPPLGTRIFPHKSKSYWADLTIG
jgi:hypothetical protein